MYSSGQPFSRPGPAPGNDPTGPALADAPEFEPECASGPEPSAEQISPGLLMSFLTDFRSAEYELIRMKRAAELEQSRRKPRTPPAVPVGEEPVPQPDYSPDYSGVSYAGAEGSAPADHHPVNDADFLNAASQAQDPGGKRRMRLGLPSFNDLRQSPATA